jgi:hypothetical protein
MAVVKYHQLSLTDLNRMATVHSIGVSQIASTPQDQRTHDAIREVIDKARQVAERTGSPVSICLVHAVRRGSVSKLVKKGR